MNTIMIYSAYAACVLLAIFTAACFFALLCQTLAASIEIFIDGLNTLRQTLSKIKWRQPRRMAHNRHHK
jgi:hypothetical protein